MRLLLSFLTIVFILGVPKAAHAQDKIALAPNFHYNISTVRLDNAAPGDFTIRLTSAISVSGCYETTKPKIEMLNAGTIIFVTIEEGEIKLPESRQYGHHECSKSAAQPAIDLTFNKAQLMSSGTQKIDIKNKSVGKLFDVKLDISDNKATLHTKLEALGGALAETKDAQKVMHHWFYPDNTYIIEFDHIEYTDDLPAKISTLAQSKNLTPLNEVLDGFKQPVANKGQVFVVGNGETFTEGNILGQITQAEDRLGINGPEMAEREHNVFIRKPGLYD